ncbi:MAG: chromosomal replication initiator protein DnaA [Desulfovibrio sp.]|jgi:chromosomal replication initiator protein|nr:chromosomal replication initiator protein DnaA [Desulfovibrio sp.]
MNDKWLTISENLKKMVDSGTFKVWIAPLRATVQEDGLSLQTPNAFAAEWLKRRMLGHLREAAASVLNLAPQDVNIRLGICADSDVKRQDPQRRTVLQRLISPLPLSSGVKKMDWRYRFDDFEVGVSNSVAVAAAQDICNSVGTVRALFVNAAPGLGKTHLTQAAGLLISQSPQHIRLAYMTAEDFTRQFVEALRRKEVERFRERLAELDVLLFEDVHFLQGKEKIQEVALATLKALQNKGGRVICTSSFSPRELRGVDGSLISHFCSGILTRMDPPTHDMRRRILMRKAIQFQAPLPDDVCELLAQRLRGDVRQLESCLNSLVFKARLLKCGLNPQLALEVLAQYADAENGVDMDTLVRLVCEGFGLTRKQLDSRSRRRECVTGRNTVYYLARKHTELSLGEIGAIFNRRHSTVIKGITAVEREISAETTLGRQITRAVGIIERNAGLSAS